MTTIVEEATSAESPAKINGVTVRAHELRAAIDVVVGFAADLEDQYARVNDEADYEADYVLVDFVDGRLVLDAGDGWAWAMARVPADEGFQRDPILVERRDLHAVSVFIEKATGDVATDVTVTTASDGYLLFCVGDEHQVTVAYEEAEEPYVPTRRTPALVAAGATLAIVAYLAIRAITRHRTRS